MENSWIEEMIKNRNGSIPRFRRGSSK